MFPLKYQQHIATLIGADAKDIIFTSGATESNNMAIKGVARFYKDKKRHIITTQTVSSFGYVLSS
jgi:cysteine desulfurase